MTIPKVGSSECVVVLEVPTQQLKGLQIAAPTAAPTAENISELVELSKENGVLSHPFILPHLPNLLAALGSKKNDIRNAAQAAADLIFAQIEADPNTTAATLPILLEACDAKNQWQTRAFACKAMARMNKSAPGQITLSLPEIIPIVSGCVNDARPQVAEAAREAMEEVCKAIQNKDIDHLIPIIMSALARPTEVPEAVHKLSACVFIEKVEAPVLSMLVPLLVSQHLPLVGVAVGRSKCCCALHLLVSAQQ